MISRAKYQIIICNFVISGIRLWACRVGNFLGQHCQQVQQVRQNFFLIDMEPWLAGTWRSSSLPLMFFCRRSPRYQQWIIFHKSGSSHLQPEASSGLPEKSFRVRSKRDGGDEGGGVVAWQRWGPGTALSHQVTHYSLLTTHYEYHDMTLLWHELHIFQKKWHFHSVPRERWPIIQSWSLFSNPTTPTLKRSSPRSKRSR